jgi:hypothetical protein
MRNSRAIVTVSELNSGSVKIIDPMMTYCQYDVFGNVLSSQFLYPIDIQLINDCGANIEFNSILHETEYIDYQKDPTQFAFQRLPSNSVLQPDHTNFERCYKFLLRKYSGTATSDLTIEFINHR